MVKAVSKVALITGISGQDGAYLSQLLLEKGYEVHGFTRRKPINGSKNEQKGLFYHENDLTDLSSIVRTFQDILPDEVYNLAAQSNVQTSFERPEYTSQVNALGTLRLLETIKILQLQDKIRYFQASTGEVFGKNPESPKTEKTAFHPCNPYAVSKTYAHWITVNYRESYGMFACNGILFNHESPMRPISFVTRKITASVARISKGMQEVLVLGNLDAKRDWGFAGVYVKAMWLTLQQSEPQDYIFATGKAHSVRDFVEIAFREVGIGINWEGNGLKEIGKDISNGRILVRVSPDFYRPLESNLSVGNSAKAYQMMGWKPETSFEELVRIMVRNDLRLIEND
ncbi:MAG: GDPmannose 4,6-dehydratase [Methanolobus sp. T82-4]|nr:MAG: GDPmannose 4,6-dehydratase [Methanolobus sp. T82-4]